VANGGRRTTSTVPAVLSDKIIYQRKRNGVTP